MKNETEQDKRPGPDPERVKIEEEDWEDAVKRALKKEKPAEGWPEEEEEEEGDGDCDERSGGYQESGL